MAITWRRRPQLRLSTLGHSNPNRSTTTRADRATLLVARGMDRAAPRQHWLPKRVAAASITTTHLKYPHTPIIRHTQHQDTAWACRQDLMASTTIRRLQEWLLIQDRVWISCMGTPQGTNPDKHLAVRTPSAPLTVSMSLPTRHCDHYFYSSSLEEQGGGNPAIWSKTLGSQSNMLRVKEEALVKSFARYTASCQARCPRRSQISRHQAQELQELAIPSRLPLSDKEQWQDITGALEALIREPLWYYATLHPLKGFIFAAILCYLVTFLPLFPTCFTSLAWRRPWNVRNLMFSTCKKRRWRFQKRRFGVRVFAV